MGVEAVAVWTSTDDWGPQYQSADRSRHAGRNPAHSRLMALTAAQKRVCGYGCYILNIDDPAPQRATGSYAAV